MGWWAEVEPQVELNQQQCGMNEGHEIKGLNQPCTSKGKHHGVG